MSGVFLGGKESREEMNRKQRAEVVKRYRETRSAKLLPLIELLDNLEAVSMECASLYDGGERTELLHICRKAGDFRSFIGWLLLDLKSSEYLDRLRMFHNDL